MQRKTCRKCGVEFPATLEYFYKNAGGKYGVTPRCKPCVDQDNKKSHRKRLEAAPEKIRAQQNARTRKSYYKHLEKNRAMQREYQARNRADPQKNHEIKARKRAGGARLSADELEALFQAQGCVCAICGTSDPGSKIGWNVDHCHATGKVRFVLCAHCNRGLGAFRDRPDIMRKAADMIEIFNKNQADKPVAAIMA